MIHKKDNCNKTLAFITTITSSPSLLEKPCMRSFSNLSRFLLKGETGHTLVTIYCFQKQLALGNICIANLFLCNVFLHICDSL